MHVCLGDFAPLINTTARRGAKANMVDTGPHWLECWTLPLALSAHGILGEDFWNVRKQKRQLVLSSPRRGGCPLSPTGLPTVANGAYEQRPGGTDSNRCLKLDSNCRPANPPTFMILLGGKRGSWCNLELSWQRVTGWFFFGCLRGNGLWDRNIPLFPKTLLIIALWTDFCSCVIFSSWTYAVDVILWLLLSLSFITQIF